MILWNTLAMPRRDQGARREPPNVQLPCASRPFAVTAGFVMLAYMLLTTPVQAEQPTLPERFVGEKVPIEIERMVDRGQSFLARMQGEDGRWSEEGNSHFGPAMQALALLALMADGEDPRFGRFSSNIERGTVALLNMQDENGYFGPTMYHHAFASLALAELYGTIDQPRLGPALQKSVDLIVDASEKNQFGAWRYNPTSTDADTTISGGQVVALLAARNAGINVPNEPIDSALEFFEYALQDDGGVGYNGPSGGGSTPRNAIAVLIADLSGRRESELYSKAWSWLKVNSDAPARYFFYYLYYAAQAYFRAEMSAWREWNQDIGGMLATSQSQNGSWNAANGPIFSTAAAIMTMAPNYRYLPIYER